MHWLDGVETTVEDLVNPGAAARAGIAGGRVTVAYQPQVDPTSGRTVGAEALVRVELPDGTIAPNDRWIARLEAQGEMAGIDLHVARRALDLLTRFRPSRPEMTMALNLSPGPGNAEYVDALFELMEHYRLPHEAVVVEVTETIAVDDLPRLAATTEALDRAGVRVALDDFGTGWNSLQLAHRLTLHELKVDRRLVADLVAGAPRVTPVIDAVFTLAEGLGVSVVAEGMEDQEHAAACSRWDFDRYQGYGFGRPGSAGQLLAQLTDRDPLVPATEPAAPRR